MSRSGNNNRHTDPACPHLERALRHFKPRLHWVGLPLSAATLPGTRASPCSRSVASPSGTCKPSPDTPPPRSRFSGTHITMMRPRAVPPTRWATYSPTVPSSEVYGALDNASYTPWVDGSALTSYLPLLSAAIGAFIGAAATGIFRYVEDKLARRQERKSLLLLIDAEVYEHMRILREAQRAIQELEEVGYGKVAHDIQTIKTVDWEATKQRLAQLRRASTWSCWSFITWP